MEISLARVLKIKKILAGKLVTVQSEILAGNSVYEGAEQPDINALVEQRASIIKHLVSLKAEQTRANAGINRVLFNLAEAKSSLVFWKSLDTANGETGQLHYGSNQKQVMVAIIKKDEKAKYVADLEKAIEDLQEQVDQYNYSTKISVSDDLMAAAGLSR